MSKRKLFLRKTILFLIGYCAYIAIEVSYRGWSGIISGLMGGVAFVLIDSINDEISWDLDLLLQGIIGSAIITYLELVVGEFLKVNHFHQMWNYGNMPLNYDGVICLSFSILWILLSIISIFVADAINYYWLGDSEQPYYKLFGKELFRFRHRFIMEN